MIKPGGKCVIEIHEPSKADWKLFRERVPEGQEKYIARLCDEYAAILTGKDRRYEAFWTIEKRIQEDKKRPDVMAQMSKLMNIFRNQKGAALRSRPCLLFGLLVYIFRHIAIALEL